MILYLRYRENRRYEENGEKLIIKIENYKKTNGKLPLSVSELGIEEEMGEGPYYEKIDSITHKVFLNIGFDNTKTYYSSNNKWIDEKQSSAKSNTLAGRTSRRYNQNLPKSLPFQTQGQTENAAKMKEK